MWSSLDKEWGEEKAEKLEKLGSKWRNQGITCLKLESKSNCSWSWGCEKAERLGSHNKEKVIDFGGGSVQVMTKSSVWLWE